MAAVNFVEAQEEFDEGAFAGAGGADDRDGLSGGDIEGEMFEDGGGRSL